GLSGYGSDEVSGGYNRYMWTRHVVKRMMLVPCAVRSSVGRAIASVPAERLDSIAAGLGSQQRNPGLKLHKLAEALHAENLPELYRLLSTHWQGAVVAGARRAGASGQ